jgi:transcriptional regulator with PAS, ATPase and Fis domain
MLNAIRILYHTATQNVAICYSVAMSQDPIAEDKAAKLERKQALERLALETGQKYAQLANEMASDRQFIVEELMPQAVEASISVEALAQLLGISRQTLYRWQEALAS